MMKAFFLSSGCSKIGFIRLGEPAWEEALATANSISNIETDLSSVLLKIMNASQIKFINNNISLNRISMKIWNIISNIRNTIIEPQTPIY